MFNTGQFPTTRLRRLRGSNKIRQLVREVHLNVDKLIAPLFIKHGSGIKKPIDAMPGHFQLSIDQLEEEVQLLIELGVKNLLLFGIPACKDPLGSDSYNDNGIIQTAIRKIKSLAPHLLIITDLCFCEYTDHGHCGVISNKSNRLDVDVDNDTTLELLALQALSHAKAGADVVAPSGNIDGMVKAIRTALDTSEYSHIPILSYAVKYSSSMYGPFRQAAEGTPQFGNRQTYQMDFSNTAEAIRETALDINEGTDLIMVKPAHTYLDIIYRIKRSFPALPLGAYHTSGEFAMLKAAAEKGWLDEIQAVKEVLTAMHRAGADFIITYYTKEVAHWIANGKMI